MDNIGKAEIKNFSYRCRAPGLGCTLGVPLCECVKQISYGEPAETKNGTPEVEIVPGAMLQTPVHSVILLFDDRR
jgi:hypothetical protein